jgi:hypothetical protein
VSRSQLFHPTTYAVRFGSLVNISGGGLGILLDEPLRLRVALRVEVACGGAARLLTARVVRRTKQDGGWLHGCKLTQPLSQAEVGNLLGQ